jgi:phosphohistidine swiveling domain-containing protein
MVSEKITKKITRDPKNNFLAQKFLSEIKATGDLTTLHNYSLFIFGSGYNTAKYYQPVFKKQPAYALLNLRFKGKTGIFLPEHAWREYGTEVFTKYLKNPASVIRIEKNFYHNFPEIDKRYYKYTYDFIAQQAEKKLLPILGNTFDLFWATNAWSHFSVYFDLDLCYLISKKAYSDVTRLELEDIWHEATDMVAESFDKAQKRDILNYLIKNGNDENLTEYCQYFFTTYKHVLSLKEAAREIKKTYGKFLKNPKLAQAEIKKMDAEKLVKEKAFKIWRAKLSLRQKRVADFCQLVMHVRDQRKNHFAKGITTTWRIAEKIFETAGVDKQLIENVILIEELTKGSRYIAAIKKTLIKRNNSYAVYVPYRGKKQISYHGLNQEYKIINKYIIRKEEKTVQEIKGQIGNRGITQGIVRIIKSPTQFNSFQKNEILVTGMTRPEYVSLMRKAKAIITDEGGITCHAAIVSRELNKPCVIGTKFATRVLKDGDLVEVNADKGVVKIL